MKDALLFAGKKASKIASGTYVNITTKSPVVFKMLYKAGNAISSDKHKSVIYFANKGYGENLYRYICKNNIDAVVTSHLFPAEALTYLKRKKGLKTVCFGIATDYTSIPFWEETELDYYFIPHRDLFDEFKSKCISGEQLVSTGIPVSKKFSVKSDKAEARKSLGLRESGRIILIMTGSMGYGNIEKLTDTLLNSADENTEIVILGGNNEKLKGRLRCKYSADFVKVIDFTDKVDVYMDACDIIFTKPGGLTSTEAAVKNIPIIHTDPIPGCETINAEFYSSRGMSVTSGSIEELVKKAYNILNDINLQAHMIECQKKEINKNSNDLICDFILSHI